LQLFSTKKRSESKRLSQFQAANLTEDGKTTLLRTKTRVKCEGARLDKQNKVHKLDDRIQYVSRQSWSTACWSVSNFVGCKIE